MKFKKGYCGYYINEERTIEIRKYGDMWEVYTVSKYEKAKYIGARYTLKEAKELASTIK